MSTISLFSAPAEAKTFFRAGVNTFPTADTFRRAGYFGRGKLHRTGLLARLAHRALFLFPMNLHQTKFVKKAVYGTERTQILAKGPEAFYRKNHNPNEYSQFPVKKPASLRAQRFVHAKQRQRAKQCTRRAQIFTESRNFRKTAL